MANEYPVPSSNAETVAIVTTVGQSVFNYDFIIYRPTQIRVIVRRDNGDEIELDYQSQFTVSGAGNPNGGSVNFIGVDTYVNDEVYIWRDTIIEREKKWQNEGDYKADLVNAEQDDIYQIMQENRRGINQSLKLPIGEQSIDLPRAEERAGKYLSFGEDGQPQAVTDVHDVSTVAGISDEIRVVSGIAPQVINLSGISGQVENVSGISNDVIEVSSISGDIVEVVEMRPQIDAIIADKSNIATVSDNIINVNKVSAVDDAVSKVAAIDTDVSNVSAIDTDVSRVSAVSSEVQTVAADRENISAVADNKTNIDTVAGSKTNIDAVAANKPNIDAVAGNADNINNVAANKTNIDKVAANEVRINAVAANETRINAVAGNETNINTVAAHAADVDLVSENMARVIIVADDMQKVETVAIISPQITVVSGIKDEVETVAAIGEDVVIVSNNIASVLNVAGNKTNIDIVALNIADIQNASQNMAEIKAAPDAASRSETAAGQSEEYRDEALAVFANMKGGAIGYALVKRSAADYDYEWREITGIGDMTKAVFDPTGVNGDAFSMGNMVETTSAKVMTAAERTKLAGIPADADKTPTLATVATTGSYGDLSNKPTIPAAQVQTDWNAASGISSIANKPATFPPSPHTHTPAEVGLGNVANKTEAQMVASGAIADALGDKLDKTGTAADSAKLGNETAAQWNAKIAAAGNWPGVYTGSSAGETNFPIGHMLTANKFDTIVVPVNSTVVVRLGSGDEYLQSGSGAPLTGVWACRGVTHLMQQSYNRWHLFQRIA